MIDGSGQETWIRKWLLSCCIIVLIITWWGGVTRLTKSGLSITEWNVIHGILPPLSEDDWVVEKQKYEQTPEYKIVNHGILLEDFKKIYLIEYLHRILGRFLFFLLLIPYLFFLFKGKTRKPSKHLYFITVIALICIQGLFGWYMVKSGLNKNPEVSHYMLALHLSMAMCVFLILWYPVSPAIGKKEAFLPMLILLLLTAAQITLGALNAGLKAGMIYNTFPLMNGQLIPDEIAISFSDAGFMQLVHRMIAVGIMIISCGIVAIHYRNSAGILLIMITALQISLGAATVLTQTSTLIASSHQVVAFLVIGTQLSMLKKSGRPTLFSLKDCKALYTK